MLFSETANLSKQENETALYVTSTKLVALMEILTIRNLFTNTGHG